MKKYKKAVEALMLMTAMVFTIGCTKEPSNNDGNGGDLTTIPVVETMNVILVNDLEIKTIVKGAIVSDGGEIITECGFCWSTQLSPTINDDHVAADTTAEVFSCEIPDLNPDSVYNVRAYAINSRGIGYGNELSFIPLAGNGGGTYNGYEYVDLSLPCGTLWATCNIGADTPEGYGDYFAWGETQPKTTYNWSTYTYCNGGDGWNTLTKYCSQSYSGYNGFTDNLTELQPMDDAAMANWGSGWCMPTKVQWEELYQNTTNQWTTKNGINGWLFTASNGNSLFLPAAGCCGDDELDGAGNYGSYWSSSLYTDIPNGAFYFYFSSGHFDLPARGRVLGQSVRAVRSAPRN